MANLIVSASNLYALRAIDQVFRYGGQSEAVLLTSAAFASIIYHALESAKHDMTGIPKFQRYENIALWTDRILASMATARFLWVYKNRINRNIILLGIISVACLMASECQHVIDIKKYVGRHTKLFYILTHIAWHLGAFHIAYLLAKRRVQFDLSPK